jgi:hypothetical protein
MAHALGVSMIIERSGFLLMAGTLAAGGVGGWLVHDSKSHAERQVAPPTPVVTPAAPPASVVVIEHLPPPPVCDDSVGTPEDCPAVGPSDEGMCSNLAAKRCADFKLAFKPKVAQAAVACLRHLKPNEMCDAARVNLCGHTALMAACPDPTPAPASQTAGGTDLGSAPVTSPVSLACENIIKGCAGVSVGPTTADCRQTLSGLSDTGRANMTECMASHCADKGLLGCEGFKKP